VRGCLLRLLIWPVLLLVVAWFGLPPLASAAISAGLGAAGFHASAETVDVIADPPLKLLVLRADQVHLRASRATFRGLTLAGVDLTVTKLSVLERSAGTIDGTLTGVTVPNADGGSISVATIGVSGSGAVRNVAVRLGIDLREVETLAAAALGAPAGSIATVTLAGPDRATIVVAGSVVAGRLLVDATGALVFRPAHATAGIGTSLVLARPDPATPIRLTGVVADPAGLTVEGALDLSLFGG